MSVSSLRRTIACLLPFFLLAGCTGADNPEYFEGTVTMMVEVDLAEAGVPADFLYAWHGTSQVWTYRSGDFRVDYSGSEFRSFWYRLEDDREYMWRVCDDVVTWNNVDSPLVEIVSIRQTDEEREIAGYTALALEARISVNGSTGITRYWYVPELAVNPEWYATYRVAGFDRIYEHIDSLIVGIESEAPNVSRLATQIDVRPVQDDEIELPDLPTRFQTFEDAMQRPPCQLSR